MNQFDSQTIFQKLKKTISNASNIIKEQKNKNLIKMGRIMSPFLKKFMSTRNKVFQFFQKGELVKLTEITTNDDKATNDEGKSSNPFEKKNIKKTQKNETRSNWISTTASGGGLVVLADIDGPLYIMQNDFEIKSTFEGFKSTVERIVLAKDQNILCGLGEDISDQMVSSFKMWTIDPSLEFPHLILDIPLLKSVPVCQKYF